MRIASSILRDRVFQEVRAKRNLSYAPEAFLRSQGANIGGIYVTAVDANQSVHLMLDEIARLQKETIDNQDIQAVVAQYLTSYYLGQETNAAQAAELAQFELLGGGWRNSMSVIEQLSAVTPADVQKVALKYMRNIRFVVLGDPKSIDTRVFTGRDGSRRQEQEAGGAGGTCRRHEQEAGGRGRSRGRKQKAESRKQNLFCLLLFLFFLLGVLRRLLLRPAACPWPLLVIPVGFRSSTFHRASDLAGGAFVLPLTPGAGFHFHSRRSPDCNERQRWLD